MTELYIENKRLDLNQELDALLTFSIDDIKDFSTRNCTFSKTIILPGTANNNKLFGGIFDVRVSNFYDSSSDNVETNFNPAVRANALIFQNRLQVFKGTLQLLKITLDKGVEYEVAVFGELGGLVSSLGTLKLEDLDFSAYDQAWTVPNVTGSWEQLNATGVCWPLIDYGTVSVNKQDYDLRAFRPAFYVREILDKTITNAGYTWECPVWDTQRVKSWIIPNNQKSLQTLTNRLLQGIAVGTNTVIQNGFDDEAPIEQGLRTLTDFTYSGGVYTYTGTDTRTFRFETVVNGDYYSTIESIQLSIKKNGVQEYTHVPFLPPTFGTTDVNFAETFPDRYIVLSTGDTIELSAKVANNVGSYRMRTTFVRFEAYLAVPLYVDASPGAIIAMNDVLPKNILQKDFLSSVVKLSNLYIYEDPLYPKKLLIKPYVDFYDLNPSGVVDWNYKVDRGKPLELQPMSELNSRYYNFNYKLDADYYNELYNKTYNETYGNYIYDSAYEFAGEKTDIDLIFASSTLVGYAGRDKIVSTFFKKNAGVEERYSVLLRILQFKKIIGVSSWNIYNVESNLATGLTSYGYAGHYDDPDVPANDIHFGVPRELYFTLVSGAVNVTQFNVYWSPYMAEIVDKDSKLLTCMVKLDNADIFSLDFSKLIYIDGAYWRLNKIEDWDAANPNVARCSLLKVINLLY